MQFGRQAGVFREPNRLVPNVRFGSLADLFTNLSLMSAFECKADVRDRIFGGDTPNVPFSRKRTFRLLEIAGNDGPLTARSGHSHTQKAR